MGVFVVSLLICIVSLRISMELFKDSTKENPLIVSLIICVASFYILVPAGILTFKERVDQYSYYVRVQSSPSEYSEGKKDELNRWLSEAQTSREMFGWFSTYPTSVTSLKFID